MTLPRLNSAFAAAREDQSRVVLEGIHAIKHAMRFGAILEDIVIDKEGPALELLRTLAPDVAISFEGKSIAVSRAEFTALASRAHHTGAIGIALKPTIDLRSIERVAGPIVLLEDPRNLGNLGACVRVAAAAYITAVITTGPCDPWHADAIRGSAGLHFAVPTANVGGIQNIPSNRSIIAFDPDGQSFDGIAIAENAILAFGTEREGLSDALLDKATSVIRLPMRPGVSSLNLATTVAAAVYSVPSIRSRITSLSDHRSNGRQ